jgi:hypothetical protein
VKEIWLRLLKNGARLDVKWTSGDSFVANGVDALSRRRWAPGTAWIWRRPAFTQITAWVGQWGSPMVIETQSVGTGAAYAEPLPAGTVSICYPGANSLEDWIGHLQRQRVVACVVVPMWDGPGRATVERSLIERKFLGPAYMTFVAHKEQEIPAWPMEAVVVDFSKGVVEADAAAGGVELGLTSRLQGGTETEPTGWWDAVRSGCEWLIDTAVGALSLGDDERDLVGRMRGGTQSKASNGAATSGGAGATASKAQVDGASDWVAGFHAGASSVKSSGGSGVTVGSGASPTVSDGETLPAWVQEVDAGVRQWSQAATRGTKRPSEASQPPKLAQGEGPLVTGQDDQAWLLQPSGFGRRDRPPTAGMDPSQLLGHARELQKAARAPSTRVSYLHWWRTFAQFTVKVGWAEREEEVPLPVPEEVLLMWIAFLSERYASSTIEISLAAVSAIHHAHSLPTPTTLRAVKDAVEGAARTGPVNGVVDTMVITPDIMRMFMRLDSVTTATGKRWSDLRLKRAVAMACVGFGAFLRKGEIDDLCRCDITRQHDGTTVIVKAAKNDQVGRGRSSTMGAGVGDAGDAEQAVWDWVSAAEMTVSTRCEKAQFPSEFCRECGPLFPRLASGDRGVTKTPWGKSRVTEELRELLAECARRSWLPAGFDVKRFSGIALRRGGNSAAAAAGISSLMRAAQGRWRCTETPDEKYTILHRTEMVQLATTIYA